MIVKTNQGHLKVVITIIIKRVVETNLKQEVTVTEKVEETIINQEVDIVQEVVLIILGLVIGLQEVIIGLTTVEIGLYLGEEVDIGIWDQEDQIVVIVITKTKTQFNQTVENVLYVVQTNTLKRIVQGTR